MKIIVMAPRGKMASLVLQEAERDKDIEIVAGVGPAGRDYIGTEICGAEVFDDLDKVIDRCDAVVDYSSVQLSLQVLDSCLAHGKALLCGTTGFDSEQNEKFIKASEVIPIVKTANTSYMVNVMMKMLELAADKLSGMCSVDILDLHDEDKRDAPSGTALEIGELIEKAGHMREEKPVYHSIRSGDISSTHTVYFGGTGERIEVTHRAYDWRCYAVGACRALHFLAGRDPGMYTMNDVAGW